MISVVIRSTLLQLLVPDHLMGRVTSVNAIFIGSSNEIGSFESGVTAKLMGAVPAVLSRRRDDARRGRRDGDRRAEAAGGREAGRGAG